MGHKSKATKKNKAKKENRGEIKRTLQGYHQKGHNIPTRGQGDVKMEKGYSKSLLNQYQNNIKTVVL